MSEPDNRSQDKNIVEQISELRNMIAVFEESARKMEGLDEALSEFQEMIAHFSDIAKEGIVLVRDIKYIWANRAACEILGYSRDELLKLSVRDTTVPDLRDKMEAAYSLIVAEEDSQKPTEWRALRGDRTIRYLRAFGYPVKYQHSQAVLCVFYDITEEKRLHEELQLRAILLDSVSDSVFMLDVNGKIIFVNEAAYTTRGYTKEELLGRSIIDITPDAHKRRARILLNQFSEHKVTRFETAHICKGGSEIEIEVQARAIRINKTIYFLGAAREKKSATDFTIG